MKKTLLLFTLCLGVILGASAQCTPNRADSVYFTASADSYPDTIYAVVGTALTGQVVSYLAPHDLPYNAPILGIISVHIDSMRIDSITGYPAGITGVSTPALGTWLQPGSWGCISITGTATTVGTYSLVITGTARYDTTILGQHVDTIVPNVPLSTVYPITVKISDTTTGISEIAAGMDLNIFPNPNQGNFTVTLSSSASLTGTMAVVDQLGRAIHTQSIDVAGTKEIPLELGDIAPGAYILVINTESGRSVKQFIVK